MRKARNEQLLAKGDRVKREDVALNECRGECQDTCFEYITLRIFQKNQHDVQQEAA